MNRKAFDPERIGMEVCFHCNSWGRKDGEVCSTCGGFGFIKRMGSVYQDGKVSQYAKESFTGNSRTTIFLNKGGGLK